MNRFKTWLALLACALLAACASTLKPPDAAAVPDGQRSLVVGRAIVLHNGSTVAATDARASLLAPGIIIHLSPLVDENKIERNAFVAGKWATRAYVAEDGYFAAELPPGKYYVVEYQYRKQVDGVTGFRTYMPLLGSTVYQPYLVTFEVVPGRATYIGTTVHKIDDTMAGVNADGTARKGWSLNLTVRSEEAQARAWFLQRYPQWGDQWQPRPALMKPLPVR